MPIDSDLQAAGRRAAAQPVPSPPSIETLTAGAAKHSSRRRLVLSGAAMIVVMAMAFPLVLSMRGTTTVQTVTAGTSQAAAAQPDLAQLDPAPPAAQGETSEDPVDDTDSDDDSVRIELRAGDDFALSIRVLSGEQASAAAAAAASAATEILTIDDMTVWIQGTGDERTVSALVEPDEFVEVTGNAAELDMLIDVLRDPPTGERGDRQGLHGFDSFDDEQWQQFFDRFESGEFSFDIDGLDIDGLDIDGLFDGLDGLEQFLGPDGELNFDFDEFFGPDSELNFDFDEFFGPDSDFNFDFDEFFGPESDFNLDDFFGSDGELKFDFDGDELFGPDGFRFPADIFGDDFDGCIVIEHSGSGSEGSGRIEIPQGCGSTG